MRHKLIATRTAAGLSRAETAKQLGITARYYAYLELGTREGKGYIWDALEALFKTPQRQLRENT